MAATWMAKRSMPLLSRRATSVPVVWSRWWRAHMVQPHMVLSSRVAGEVFFVLATTSCPATLLHVAGDIPTLWLELRQERFRLNSRDHRLVGASGATTMS